MNDFRSMPFSIRAAVIFELLAIIGFLFAIFVPSLVGGPLGFVVVLFASHNIQTDWRLKRLRNRLQTLEHMTDALDQEVDVLVSRK